jgi:hypothetical protein
MNSIFMKVPMVVYNANVNGNAHTAGIPSMTSIDGFAHNIERKLKAVDKELFVESWNYIIEKLEYRMGTKKYSLSGFKKIKSGAINSPMEDEKLAHIEQVVILKIHTNLSEAEIKQKTDNGELNSIFNNIAFSGGTTRIRRRKSNFNISFFSDLKSALRTVNPNAILIEDKTELIKELKMEGENNLATLIRITNSENDEYHGYLIPVAIGYHAISEKIVRLNQRAKDNKHIYAEPVTGVARARTVASSLIHLHDEDFKPSWSNVMLDEDNKNSNNYYIVKGL